MKIGEYLKGTKAELKHVSWPTKNQAVVYTTVVIAISLLVAALLGLFDYIFTGLLERFIVG